MRRQITRAILAVAILLVVGLGVPLAVVVQRFYEDGAVADLQRQAAETIAEISLPLRATGLKTVAREPDSPGAFSVYDGDGRRLFGRGPGRADDAVRQALAGGPASARGRTDLVVAAPVTDRSSETIVGAVRVSQPRTLVDREVRRAWLVMVAAVVLALGGATVLARRQAGRLADPVVQLARQAVDLGRGDFTSRSDVSGIEEVDVVAAALDASAARLADLLARERSFSADVSHQLRTPLTGLRLRLERARADAPSEPLVQDALEEIGRLEATVEHLLALSRDRHPVGAPLDVSEVLAAAGSRWQPRYHDAGRELRVGSPTPRVEVRASHLSIGQVLDVLLDNALRHGAGAVSLRARAAVGGLVLEVSDEGAGITEDRRDLVFDRHEGRGSGIGLALARSITEAEGGRLLLASGRPPCFQIVLPTTE